MPRGVVMSNQQLNEYSRIMERDRFVYRVVISVLSVLALAVAGTAVVLAIKNNGKVDDFPVILTALGSAALGALAGIVAPVIPPSISRRQKWNFLVV
jgi:hypothetical protein